SGFDLFGFGFADLVAMLLQRLFDVVDHGIGAIARVDRVLELAVLGSVGFGVARHLFDLILGETARTGDGDLLFVVGAAILGGDIEDPVGIDIEGDFDLRHAGRARRNIAELEYAQQAVVAGHGALTLMDLDLYRRLVVAGRGENLALAGGNGGVALDQLVKYASHGLDTDGLRGHVEQQDVLDFAAEYAALNGSSHRDDFVGIH